MMTVIYGITVEILFLILRQDHLRDPIALNYEMTASERAALIPLLGFHIKYIFWFLYCVYVIHELTENRYLLLARFSGRREYALFVLKRAFLNASGIVLSSDLLEAVVLLVKGRLSFTMACIVLNHLTVMCLVSVVLLLFRQLMGKDTAVYVTLILMIAFSVCGLKNNGLGKVNLFTGWNPVMETVYVLVTAAVSSLYVNLERRLEK